MSPGPRPRSSQVLGASPSRLPKGPSFRSYRATTAASSRVGRANRSRGTKPELALRKALWRAGLRYRLHDSLVRGRPDIVNRRKRVAIFVDGDFWHGRDWRSRRRKLAAGSNSAYWLGKIGSNRARDLRVTQQLRSEGWTVIRVWETDATRDPDGEAKKVLLMLRRTSPKR